MCLDGYSHVDGVWLTCGTDAFISADLQNRVREPHCCFTGWVTHTGQEPTAREQWPMLDQRIFPFTLLCVFPHLFPSLFLFSTMSRPQFGHFLTGSCISRSCCCVSGISRAAPRYADRASSNLRKAARYDHPRFKNVEIQNTQRTNFFAFLTDSMKTALYFWMWCCSTLRLSFRPSETSLRSASSSERRFGLDIS